MASDIDLNRLTVFKDVVLAGSFTKAAEQMHQPKSRISRNIAALERELGVQLIYRTTRQFRLTQAGTELFQRALPHLNELRDALERISSSSDEVVGTIRMTVPEDIGVHLMGEIINEFMLLYPKVRVDLHVGNEKLDLVKESFDIAVRVGQAKDSTMIQRKIGQIGLALYLSPSLRSRYGGISRMDELERVPYLAFGHQVKAQALKLSNGRETRGLSVSPSFSSNNFFVLKSLAILGSGFTILPPFLAQDSVQEGTLLPVFRDWKAEGAPVRILIPHQKETPVRIRRMIDFMTQKMAAIL